MSSKFGERPSKNKVGAREMDQKVKVIVAKPNGLSLSPGIPWWEQRNLWKIFSGLHMDVHRQTHPHTHVPHTKTEKESLGCSPLGSKPMLKTTEGYFTD